MSWPALVRNCVPATLLLQRGSAYVHVPVGDARPEELRRLARQCEEKLAAFRPCRAQAHDGCAADRDCRPAAQWLRARAAALRELAGPE